MCHFFMYNLSAKYTSFIMTVELQKKYQWFQSLSTAKPPLNKKKKAVGKHCPLRNDNISVTTTNR